MLKAKILSPPFSLKSSSHSETERRSRHIFLSSNLQLHHNYTQITLFRTSDCNSLAQPEVVTTRFSSEKTMQLLIGVLFNCSVVTTSGVNIVANHILGFWILFLYTLDYKFFCGVLASN